MKIENFLCVVSFLFIVNFISSLFVLNRDFEFNVLNRDFEFNVLNRDFEFNEKHKENVMNIEDNEKNNVEKIWSGIQLMLSVLVVWLILLSMEFNMYSNELFKLLCFSCIVTTSMGWDYFGRQNKKIERGVFVCLTFLCIYCIFFVEYK